MSPPTRNAVRVLLLNSSNELLLLEAENVDIATPEGMRHKRFWATVGGKVESGESIVQAALREIYEETGIKEEEVDLGPIVWFGEINLVLKATLTCLKEQFIVARTKQTQVFLNQLTEDEKEWITKLGWFSLEKIQKTDEIILPVLLPKYLPDIIAGRYPEDPLEINLNVYPKK